MAADSGYGGLRRLASYCSALIGIGVAMVRVLHHEWWRVVVGSLATSAFTPGAASAPSASKESPTTPRDTAERRCQ